jgi:hypothetical protein
MIDCQRDWQDCGPGLPLNPENEPIAKPAKAVCDLLPQRDPKPMTEAMTQVRAPKRDRSRLVPDDVVSPNGLATHLGMTRQNVARLTAEAVLVQRSDASGRQIATLRAARRHRGHGRERFSIYLSCGISVLAAVKAASASVRGECGRDSQVLDVAQAVGGLIVTAACIEQVIFEVRTEIANIAQRKADEAGEPPLEGGKS